MSDARVTADAGSGATAPEAASTTPGAAPGAGPQAARRGGRWVSIVCLVAAVLLIGGSWLFAPRTSGEEGFAGTDSTVATQLEESGVQPWFESIFTPGSSEVESGLFAVQAAAGGALFGYAVGRLHGRRRAERG